jgi:tetratricopeptide (TPR) repeat protein
MDPSAPDAFVRLGVIRTFYEWDLPGAEAAFKTAISLNPNDAEVHTKYATHLNVRRRTDEALAEIEHAIRLSPTSIVPAIIKGDIFRVGRRYDEALRQYREALEMDPNYMVAHALIADFYEQIGAYDQAVEALEKRLMLAGEPPDTIRALREAYDNAGMQAFRMKIVEIVDSGECQSSVLRRIYSRTLIRMGAADRAIKVLQKMYDERHSLLIYMNADPLYDGLRDDPRFQALLQRMGFDAGDRSTEGATLGGLSSQQSASWLWL